MLSACLFQNSLLTLCTVFLISPISSQSLKEKKIEVHDSIKELSYKDLYKLHYDNRKNDTLRRFYDIAFLKKAYQEKDSLNITKGYYIITTKYNENNLTYCDSLIKYSENMGAKSWVWIGHYRKGIIYNKLRDFKNAFNNHLQAYKFAQNKGLYKEKDLSVVSLALLKERIGKNEEALIDFQNSYKYWKQIIRNQKIDFINYNSGNSYISRLTLLSNSYRLKRNFGLSLNFKQRVSSLPKSRFCV